MLELQRWLYAGTTTQLKTFAGAVEPTALLWGLCIAALFGLVHAIMPGHGKTVLVSYLVGRPSKMVAGLTMSVILVLTHVGSAVLMVIGGFIAIRATIGGVGRAPAFETASALFIVLIGIWLSYNALHRHQERNTRDGTWLAVATGLVPCPLTTFIMVYAVSNGIIAAGLLITAGMALGMVTTIAIFAITAIFLRQRILRFMELTAHTRERVGQTLELIGATAIVGLGLWLLTNR